jgi:hypothetical protein
MSGNGQTKYFQVRPALQQTEPTPMTSNIPQLPVEILQHIFCTGRAAMLGRCINKELKCKIEQFSEINMVLSTRGTRAINYSFLQNFLVGKMIFRERNRWSPDSDWTKPVLLYGNGQTRIVEICVSLSSKSITHFSSKLSFFLINRTALSNKKYRHIAMSLNFDAAESVQTVKAFREITDVFETASVDLFLNNSKKAHFNEIMHGIHSIATKSTLIRVIDAR